VNRLLPTKRAGTFLLAVASAFLPSGVQSWSASPPAKARPNLVLITAEGLRPDRLGCYGGKLAAVTPHIDSLAAEGRLFEQVVTSSVSSMPAMATLLTGRTPFEHQVWDDHYRNRLPAGSLTLAERLKKEGYKTAAFIASSRLEAARGLDQGFDLFQDGYKPPPDGTWRLFQRPGITLNLGVSSWLEGVGKAPFFLWAHFTETATPPPYRQNPSDDVPHYAAQVARLDAQIGEIFKVLKDRKLYDGSTIILTADHGMGLGEHGESRAGIFLYDSTVRIPLLIKAPGSPKGKRAAELAGLVDLFPTVERLLKVRPTEGLAGRDLFASGQPPRSAYYAVALRGREIFGWAPLELMARGSMRWISGSSSELYDTASDPLQQRDLSGSSPGARQALEQERQRLSQGSALPAPHFLASGEIPEAMTRRLTELGFVAPTLEKAKSRVLPDPRKSVPHLRMMEFGSLGDEILGLVAVKPLADDLVKEEPQGLFSLLLVAQIRMGEDAGKGEGVKAAKALLKTAQEVYPRDAEVYHRLGHLAFLEKRFPDAELFEAIAGKLAPRYPSEISYDLACALARQGKNALAVAELRKAIELGYRDAKHIASDADLESLRQDPAFKSLMQEEFQAAATP
jgi:arylsulfatase A-like enzyme